MGAHSSQLNTARHRAAQPNRPLGKQTACCSLLPSAHTQTHNPAPVVYRRRVCARICCGLVPVEQTAPPPLVTTRMCKCRAMDMNPTLAT